MPGITLTIELDDAAVQARLSELIQRLEHPEGLWRNVGEYMTGFAVPRNFATATSPDGRPWAPLSPVTIARRAKAGKNTDTILQVTRHLAGNIVAQVDAAGLRVGSLHYVREHELHGSPTGISRHFVVIGPWDHEGTRSGSQRCGGIDFGNAAEVDLRRLTLDWYDWTLRDGPRPALLSRRVMAYDTGAACWTGRDRIVGPDTEDMPLFLDGRRAHETPSLAGRLTVSLPRTDSRRSWHSDPADCRLAEAEARPWADWLTEPPGDRQANETGLVWETDPLPQDIRLFGWPKATLWIETTLPDADLQATLAHVGADGGYLKLSDDLLRLRYREGIQQELPCTPGAPMRAELDGFTFVSRLIRAGSRLRLTVRTVNSIHLQRNFQAGGNIDAESLADARAGWICIRQGGRYDSRMSIPLAVRT